MVIGLRAAGFAVAVPVFLCATPVFAADSASARLTKEFEDSRHLDWVPVEKLTEAQKQTLPNECCKGAYVAPERTDTEANLQPEDAPVRAHSDEEISERQTRLEFRGNVSITQGNRSITTDSASYDKESKQAKLTGSIQVRDPEVMVRADVAEVNLDSGDAHFDNARFVLYETRVHGVAQHLRRFGDNVINLEQSMISSCEPGDNAWSIRGSEISLHPDEHYGTAENMRLNIKNIPVLYVPYIRFPVGEERLTGFLTPTPGYSSRNGFELSVPFYWNIAPSTDATLTAHYMSSRGYMLEPELRNLTSYFETKLSGSFINNDHGGYSSFAESQIAAGVPEEVAYPYRGHDRWFAKLEQDGGKGRDWSTTINYSDLSDKDYLRDMYSGSVESNRQAYIRQMVSADYRSEHWFSGIKVDEYRLLTTTQLPYRELPRIHVDGNYQINDWVLQLNNEYVNFVQNRYFASSFDKRETYENALANTIYGDRINTDYSLTWDKSYSWGFVKPRIGVKGLAYKLDDRSLVAGTDDSPSFVTPQASVDAGLYFERDANVFGGNYLQTLEPRAFYFYSAYQNQDSLYKLTPNNSFVNFDLGDLTFNYNQLFRTTRFAGGDRLDDANQLSLAVSTAFSSQDTGAERLRMSIGQIFYGRDRKIMIYDKDTATPSVLEENRRGTSNWAAQVSGQVSSRFHVSGDAAYDQRNNKLDSANVGLHYMDDSYRIANITYRYTLKPVLSSPSQPVPVVVQSINQLDTSIILPINSRWSIIARNNHDFTHGVELDTYAGLEYNDCCYRVRVLGRRWLRVDYTTPDFLANLTNKDFEPGIMVELELKGLGSMDRQISNLLERTVKGFKDREKNLR
ncbi:LPS-assembly protein LptD [Cellvibrio zantedeschiae]|uniref:LPS-assembly protein LptD n=2 Tax=Cellvibrio zantedeschiae TaxID=1237077 RepID=A0ABQ3B8S2_9GAMM|nr:LPS-assembly protein LptD [Cellvibrio zantedeschiae]